MSWRRDKMRGFVKYFIALSQFIVIRYMNCMETTFGVATLTFFHIYRALLCASLHDVTEYVNLLGYNYIQNFHLGRYIVGYTVRNLVLRQRASVAVKRDFQTYIRQYTSPNENFAFNFLSYVKTDHIKLNGCAILSIYIYV